MAGIDLLELAQLADAEKLRVPALTERQEREIVGNPELLLVALCALNRWSFERILNQYEFTRNRLIGLLAPLERVGLIEVLSGPRIRPRITRSFGWLPDGPIHRFFVDSLQGEFLSGGWLPERDVHRVAWGMVSAESASVLKAKIDKLTDTFDHLTRSDEVRSDARVKWNLPARGTARLGTLALSKGAAVWLAVVSFVHDALDSPMCCQNPKRRLDCTNRTA